MIAIEKRVLQFPGGEGMSCPRVEGAEGKEGTVVRAFIVVSETQGEQG